MAIETQGSQKTEKPSVEPRRSIFEGDEMDKFAEQIGLFAEEPESEARAKEKAPEAEPCEECPGGKSEKPKSETPPKEAPKKEEQKPFRVLKDESGKEIPVYSEEELYKLALKGATGQRQSETEKKFKEVEERLERALEQLSRIETYARGVPPPAETKPPEEAEQKEEGLDLEAIDDPVIREHLKKLADENKKLRAKVETGLQATRETMVKELQSALDQVVQTARKEYPFEDVRFEDNGENFSEHLFAGLLQEKVARDRRENRPLRRIEEYTVEAIKDLNRLENFYRGKFRNSAEKIEITADIIAEKYPQIAEEIGQRAVASYLKKLEEAPPLAKARSDESVNRKPGEKKKGWKGLDDALSAAFQDEEIVEALEEARKKTLAF